MHSFLLRFHHGINFALEISNFPLRNFRVLFSNIFALSTFWNIHSVILISKSIKFAEMYNKVFWNQKAFLFSDKCVTCWVIVGCLLTMIFLFHSASKIYSNHKFDSTFWKTLWFYRKMKTLFDILSIWILSISTVA